MSFSSENVIVSYTEEQKAHLLHLSETQQYADGYRYIRDIVHKARVEHAGDAPPTIVYAFGDSKARELVKLESWISDVVGINAGDSSAFSEFVRGSTLTAVALKGKPITEDDFQKASDKLANLVILDSVKAGGMPSAGDVIATDVSQALANVGLPESAWAGAIADFLPPPLAFGQDYVKFPSVSEVGLLSYVGNIATTLVSNVGGVLRFGQELLTGNPQSVVNTLDVLLKGLIDSPQTDQTIKGISFLPGTHSGGAGNDHITGGWFSDTLFGKDGNDVLDGGAGKDKLYGGGNNDTYIVDNVGDQVIENRGEGIDSVKASVSYSLSNNVENLYLTGKDAINGTGNDLNNLLIGNDSNNILRGNGGNDQLLGGGGNDTLIGGAGADTLVGGLGRDLFVYNTISDSTVEAVDHILDFVSGEDRIDFSGLSKFISGGGHFTFVDELVGKAGQIVFNTDSNSTKLSVDFGGDGLADFAISLIGQATAADVIVA